MGRTILTIALIGLAFWAFTRLQRHFAKRRDTTSEPAFEKTVRCARCDVYVSLNHAYQRDGSYYCCREHLPE